VVGTIKLKINATGVYENSGTLMYLMVFEDGLIGIGFDPNFETIHGFNFASIHHFRKRTKGFSIRFLLDNEICPFIRENTYLRFQLNEVKACIQVETWNFDIMDIFYCNR